MGMLALSCYVLADTYFVANALGPDGLAALNLALPVYSFIQGCGLMFGMGAAARYSILVQQGRRWEGDAAFTHALWMACGLSLLLVALGLFASAPLAGLLGAEGGTYDMTRTYVQVLLLFAPAFLLNHLLLCFVRNDGAPQRAMAGMVTGSLSNILLDYIFICRMEWGMFGAVFATGLAPLISIAVQSPFFFRRQNRFHPVRCALSPELAGLICSTGVPSLVSEVAAGIVMLVFNLILLDLRGSLAVAAYGVVANLSFVVLAIFSGLAQGAQPLFSRHCGAGNRAGVRATLGYAMAGMLLLSAALYLLLLLGAEPIALLFNQEKDPELQAIAVRGLRLYFLSAPFAGINIILSVYYPSVGRPRPAHVISLLRGFFLIVPMAYLLAALGDMDGLWLAAPLTELLIAVPALIFLRRHSQPGS